MVVPRDEGTRSRSEEHAPVLERMETSPMQGKQLHDPGSLATVFPCASQSEDEGEGTRSKSEEHTPVLERMETSPMQG